MMIDRLAGNAALKDSVRLMLGSSRLTHSVLLVGETGLGAGYAARCMAADYLYPAGGAPAEALLRGECCRAVGKAGDRDSGHVETGIVREAMLHGPKMEWRPLSGARRWRLCSLGSSTLTLRRSAR